MGGFSLRGNNDATGTFDGKEDISTTQMQPSKDIFTLFEGIWAPICRVSFLSVCVESCLVSHPRLLA